MKRLLKKKKQNSTDSQEYISGEATITINNQNVLPVENMETGNLESSDAAFNTFIQNLNVVALIKHLIELGTVFLQMAQN